MKLNFKHAIANNYKSLSQIARVLTENWVHEIGYCPSCGSNIDKYPNNQPVADFYCLNCSEDYELKSRKISFGAKVNDGAYQTMMARLNSSNNPNLFLLNYDFEYDEVKNFLVVPKHFFVPEIIEKRKPLSSTAKRAGWVGCNIILKNIPESGKIFYIKDKIIQSKESVLETWKKMLFLRQDKIFSAKGWLLDIIICIEKIKKCEFILEDIYKFENELKLLHPENKHVRDKIRQQLQILRDNGYLDFISRGIYRVL